jgi:hypothetical protein
VSHKFFQCGKHIVYRNPNQDGTLKAAFSCTKFSSISKKVVYSSNPYQIYPSNFDLKNLSRFTELINLTLLLEKLQMFYSPVGSILLQSAHLIPRSNGIINKLKITFGILRGSNLNNNSSRHLRESSRRQFSPHALN